MQRLPDDIQRRGSAERRDDPGRHFVVGGVVPVDRDAYLPRAADEALYRLAAAGEYAHIFAARQSGKSSLTARVAERLRDDDRLVAVIDVSQIGSRDDRQDAGRWFYSFAFRLLRQLRIRIDLQDWWQDKATLTGRQRLTELFWDVVLTNTTQPVTVFVDSPQSFDSVPFADELLASINAVHTARAAEPELARLNFVLLAVGEPQRYREREDLTFFAASTRVELPPFSRAELQPLANVMPLPADAANDALDRIHFWTSGQPFLTMKLARRVARQAATEPERENLVDDEVRQLFGHPTVLRNEPHLNALQNALLYEMPSRQNALNLYGRVRKGDRVAFDADLALHRRFLDEGVLIVNENGCLTVANRLYAYALTTRWVNEHLTVRLRTTAAAAAALLIALLLPLWYSQILPQGWIRTIQNPVELSDAIDAHERMRFWPLHRTQADTLLGNYLERRSLAARDVGAVRQFDALLRELPNSRARADQLMAQFWDREARRFERTADRDQALAARLAALNVPSDARLRAANALIGADYRYLTATVRQGQPIEQAALTRSANELTTLTGPTVRRYTLGSEQSSAVAEWSVGALDIYPVIQRLTANGRGTARAFELTINIEHDRLGDLVVRLTSPSGRSALLSGADAELVAGGGIRFRSRADTRLALLEDEDVDGTWTLSVVDQRPAIAGVLGGWALSFARHGQFNAEAVLAPLREPSAAPVGRTVLSPAGRYVIALPANPSGIAQVWETATQQAVASLPIGPADRIIGFVLDERVVLVARPQGLGAWALATGEPSFAPTLTAGLLTSALSHNRQFLVTVGSGPEARIVVYDLIEERSLTPLPAAADISAIGVSNNGERVAVAYADQTVRLWKVGDSAPIAEFGANGGVTHLDFTTDDSALLVRTDKARFSVWRFAASAESLSHRDGAAPWQLDVDASGQGMIVGSSAEGFQVLGEDAASVLSPVLRPGSGAHEHRVRFRAERNALLVFSPQQGVAKVFRLATGRQLPGNREVGRLAALSPDGTRLAIADANGGLYVVAAAAAAGNNPRAVAFVGHTVPVERIRFSPSGNLVASVASDGSVRVWDSADAAPRPYFIRTGSAPVVALAFSRDERLLAIASVGTVRVIDVASGMLSAERQFAVPVTSAVFGVDSNELIVGHTNGSVDRLRLDAALVGDQLRISTAAVTALAFVDGATVVADAAARLHRFSDWLAAADLVTTPTGESCQELATLKTAPAVLCRSANWIWHVPIGMASPAVSSLRVRLLPAARIHDGLASNEDGSVLTLLPRGSDALALQLPFDRSDVPAPVGNIEEFVANWRIRIGIAESE